MKLWTLLLRGNEISMGDYGDGDHIFHRINIGPKLTRKLGFALSNLWDFMGFAYSMESKFGIKVSNSSKEVDS